MGKLRERKVSSKKANKHPVEAEMKEEEEEEEEEDEVRSDDEDSDEDERKRHKLVEAIRALSGKRKKPLVERSEAAVLMSEFTVAPGSDGDRVQLSELIGTVEQTPSVPSRATKQLKNLEHSNRTVECPLSRQESERIHRDVAFQRTASEVSRWSSTISHNQRVEQQVFPLHQEPLAPRPVERVVSGWKPQTPLEQEVMALLSANKQPITNPVLTPVEEASMKAMSLEEAKIRRAELQKARALQSYYESKTRRERKIKSKKYHRVQNKGKRKEFLKQFDAMVEKDPGAALEELQKMEVARMKERMSLKHQNSGKWARSKAVMAKYDEGARRAMQQQLEVNKDLTQKLVSTLDQEEKEEEEEEEEVAAEGAAGDVHNPWMRGKLSEDPSEREDQQSVEVDVKETENAAEEEEEEEDEEAEEAALLREFERKRRERHVQKAEPEVFETVEKLLVQADHTHNSALEEGLMRIRTVEDLEELPADPEPPLPEAPPPSEPEPPAPPITAPKAGKKRKGIQLKEVLTKETEVIDVGLKPTTEDQEDQDQESGQRGLIKEAFAGDDVISDFLKEKRKQEDEGRPKDLDLTLPGWGEWGGTGLKPSRKKRRRFRVKAPPPPPRKDQQLPSVIISEKRNGALSLHQINSLPFPFESHAQFQSTMRSPLGRTWNTERTVKKVTKPRVITRLGAIIEPMSKEELVKDRKNKCNL
ncbi:U3 small nucleolar RNA-associated protein 14 homolog A [Gouania willdenowi]|uniref:U3 small nucleolar RNA-associated protein 14 homolog A-like n=1 Tax=Gouania willdenowi TaxID=441366 RepID=A0A8C5I3P5_GOUWI|nr:U3 small nucleolar RNA-associated protein 14 homolog A-like [Gouania willdenowi]